MTRVLCLFSVCVITLVGCRDLSIYAQQGYLCCLLFFTSVTKLSFIIIMDIFTKALARDLFKKFRDRLMVPGPQLLYSPSCI